MQEPNNKASLGCGTLILIALIVMIFGNSHRRDDKELKSDIRNLQSEIADLKSKIENQSVSLKQIQKSLEEINDRAASPRPHIFPPATLEAPLPEN